MGVIATMAVYIGSCARAEAPAGPTCCWVRSFMK